MRVPLLDLKGQYQSIRDKLLPEIERLLESQQFILGPSVDSLESEIAAYCDVEYAVGVASGSDALLLSLMAAGIGQGDEVITTPYTFFSTASSIVRLGARPVFVDIDPVSYNVDTDRIPEKVTGRTRAVLPVHLYGQTAKMGAIREIASKHDLLIVEDGAQAIGAEYDGKRVGALGDAGCLSFFPSKNLGGFGDGGMVTTDRSDIAEKIRELRVHGMKPKYVHRSVGINSRLDALQAAVLSVKLKHLDDWTERRRSNAKTYQRLFEQTGLLEDQTLVLPREVHGDTPWRTHVYNQYVIRCRSRNDLQSYLSKQGVGTEVYYPIPLHLQECFSFLGYQSGEFPQSEQAAGETLALPIYSELTEEMLEFVVDRIAGYYRGGKALT